MLSIEMSMGFIYYINKSHAHYTCNVLHMYRGYTHIVSLVLVHLTQTTECVDVVHSIIFSLLYIYIVYMVSFLLLYSPLPALSLALLSFLLRQLYCLSSTVPKPSSWKSLHCCLVLFGPSSTSSMSSSIVFPSLRLSHCSRQADQCEPS